MITFINTEDTSDINILINPVNCAGDINSLIYPNVLENEFLSIYLNLCKYKQLIPGMVQLIKNKDSCRYIINIPTKYSSDEVDSILYIAEGFKTICNILDECPVKIIGIPKLSTTLDISKLEKTIIKILTDRFLDSKDEYTIKFLYKK